jgi:hypothetical protein
MPRYSPRYSSNRQNDNSMLYIGIFIVIIFLFYIFRNQEPEKNEPKLETKPTESKSEIKTEIDRFEQFENDLKKVSDKYTYGELLLYAEKYKDIADQYQRKEIVNKYAKHFTFFHKGTNKILDCNGDKIYFSSSNVLGDDFFKKLRNKTIIEINPYIVWTKNGNNIQHYKSKYCLDSNGNDIYLGSCDTTNTFQHWKMDFISDNYIKLIHIKSNKCLDGNGNKFYMSNLDTNDYKLWLVTLFGFY